MSSTTAQNTGMRPGMSSNTSAKIWFFFFVVWVAASWHLTLVIFSDGLALDEPETTLLALLQLSPLDLGSDVETAEPMVILIAWGVCIVGFLVGFWALDEWRRSRKRRKQHGMAEAKSLQQRSQGKGGDRPMLEPVAWYQGQPISPSQEDSGAVLAMSGMGKSAFLLLGMLIDAPGAVVATGTKAELIRLTAQRRQRMGQLFVFDPEGMTGWRERAQWDIVAGCQDPVIARRRADAMVAAMPSDDSGNADFFRQGAAVVLRCCLHAASLSGHTMRDVLAWSRDFTDDTPLRILDNTEEAIPGWGKDLRLNIRGEAPETVSSLQMQLSRALDPLTDPNVLSTVCPDENGQTFDPKEFAKSKGDTLYLISGGEDDGAAPLLTALLETVVTEANRASQWTRAGKIKPSMLFVLDEVANVAPIPKLPQLMSDGRGRGLIAWLAIQAYSQLESRWGKEGAETIWANSSMRLVLGGSVDDSFLESISTLMGDRRITTSNRHFDDDGDASSASISTEKERKMPVSEIRQIPMGQALMVYREQPGAVVDLRPWWQRKDAKKIKAAEEWCLDLEGITE